MYKDVLSLLHCYTITRKFFQFAVMAQPFSLTNLYAMQFDDTRYARADTLALVFEEN